MMKQKILITGASGLLGLNICNRLKLNSNFELFGICRTEINFDCEDVNWVYLDLTDFEVLQEFFKKNFFDIIIHCAAYVNVDSCELNKEYVTKLHVDVINTFQIYSPDSKIIYISSDSVFDGINGNYSEQSIRNPLNFYSYSKYQGENLLFNSKMNFLILRLNIYGFHRPVSNSLVEWAIKELKEAHSINGFSNVYFNPLYVGQVSRLIEKAIENKIEGVYHVGSTESISKYNFLKKVAKVFCLDDKLIHETQYQSFDNKPLRPLNTTLNIDQMKSKLNIEFNLDDGISEMFDDYHFYTI